VQEIIGHVVESSIEILSRKVPRSGTLDLSTDDVNDSFFVRHESRINCHITCQQRLISIVSISKLMPKAEIYIEDTGTFASFRTFEFYGFVPTSSFSIAAAAPVPIFTWSLEFPSICPSGCASTPCFAPGNLLPLSLTFFSFFLTSGGG